MRERFEKGQEYYEQKKFDQAALAFREAYEIKPAASLLYNEAVCYEKMKNFGKAATLFREYLSKSGNPRDKKAVEQRIDALEREVRGTPPPPPKEPGEKPVTVASLPPSEVRGVFLIESKPPGATIYLDDKKNEPLGTTPWSGTIDGAHKVIIVSKGYKDESKEVRGKPNSVNTLYVALSQEYFLGWIEIRANVPQADVYIDDKTAPAGRTPYLGNITPGKHTFYITKEGFTEETKVLEVEAGKAHTLQATLDKAAIGFVQVSGSTIEGAKVMLDGKVVCEQAPCRFTAPSGERRVTVQKPGLKPYTHKLNVPKASEQALSVKLAPKQARTDLIWKFGFAAAFIGGGVFLGLQANKTKDDLQKEIDAGGPPLLPDDDRFLKGKIYAIAADGLFVVGGITAIFGVISLFSEKGPPSSGYVSDRRDLGAGLDLREQPRDTRKAVITPAFGPGYAGVAAEVRW